MLRAEIAACDMSTFTLDVPSDYGYVVMVVGAGSFIVSQAMGVPVMAARKKFDVKYPNLYAVPGYHKEADAFNRVQRGHQNMFESLSPVMAMTLLGGLKYPRLNAAAFALYLGGSYLYQKGYADTTLEVKTARYKKGGGIKWIGVLVALGSCVSLAGSMLKWW